MYKKLGYHLEKQLIDKAEIEDLKHKMIRVFRLYTHDHKTEYNELISSLFKNDIEGFVGCANICQNMIEVCKLSVDERIVSVLHKLGLQFPSINTRPLVSFSSSRTAKNDNYWKIPAHQDWPSTQGSINGITCWMPLVDVAEDLGPLEIAVASHLDGFIEHEDDGVPKLHATSVSFLPIPMKAGDALFFSNFTIHRSGVNKTNRIRWTMHFRYDDVEEKTFIERKFPRHRIDKRKEGILFPGFPTKRQIRDTFLNDPQQSV